MTLTIAGMAPCKLNATVLATSDLRISAGINYQGFKHSGNEFASVGVIASAIPRVSFKTPFLAAYNLIGLKLFALTTLDIYFATFAAGLRNPSGTVNSKLGINTSCSAVAYISGWSCGVNGILMAQIECIWLTAAAAGLTVPYVRTDSLALPTLGSEPQLHTLGPVAIGASPTRVDGLANVVYNQGINLKVPLNDGDQFPKTAAYMDADPALGLTHEDPLSMEAIVGLLGESIPTQVVQYFRGIDPSTKLLQTTGISMTMTSGALIPETYDFGLGNIDKISLGVKTLSNSGTHPVAIATAATLP
jgi:hypothetical protein